MLGYRIAKLFSRTTKVSVVLLLIMALASLSSGSTASAAGKEHRLIVGLATTDALVTQWWHGVEGGVSGSLDLVKTSGTTAGTNVYWQSQHTAGSTPMTVTVISPVGSCKQTRVQVKDGSTVLGVYFFKHVENSPVQGTFWTAQANSGWSIRFVGTVAATFDCDSDGPHLHQGGLLGSYEIKNSNLQSWAASHGACNTWGTNPCRITPTGDYSNRWVHRFSW